MLTDRFEANISGIVLRSYLELSINNISSAKMPRVSLVQCFAKVLIRQRCRPSNQRRKFASCTFYDVHIMKESALRIGKGPRYSGIVRTR